MSRPLIKLSQEEIGLLYDSEEFEFKGYKTTIYPFSVSEVTKMLRLAGENFSQVAQAVVVLTKRIGLQESLDNSEISESERKSAEEAIALADSFLGASLNKIIEASPMLLDSYPEIFERCTGIDRDTIQNLSAEDFGSLLRVICSVNKTQVEALVKNLFASIAFLAPRAQEIVSTVLKEPKSTDKKS